MQLKFKKSAKSIQYFYTVLLIGLATVLLLLAHHELGGESWGYWFFARIFVETGEFISMDRGPLYVVYLSLFRWLGYPNMVIAEYLVTFLLITISLLFFFRRYIGMFWALLAVILWLPFLHAAEPPVQKIALALTCLAMVLRDQDENRFRLVLFYSLLLCAYMVRSTYIVFIITFLVWDIIQIVRKQKLSGLLQAFRPNRQDWPLWIVLTLFICFKVYESPHQWNNAYYATTTWSPTDAKKISDAAFIHNYNWQYIEQKYGTQKDHDFYFTNKELFKGADNMIGAIQANPVFVVKQFVRNIKNTLIITANITLIPKILSTKIRKGSKLWPFVHLLFTLPLVFAIFYGAFQGATNHFMVVFFIASILVICTATIALPKERYMAPLIPILILSAYWYSKKFIQLFSDRVNAFRYKFPLEYLVKFCITAMMFVLFSQGPLSWASIIQDVNADIKKGDIRILESRPNSYKASFELITPLASSCRGVMTLEYLFLGAFSPLPVSRIYDVWEIPPFGQLNQAHYNGLNPDRVNCVIVSQELVKSYGGGTNHQIRYDNYIEPYVNDLKRSGAKIVNLENFGYAVILENL